MRGGGAAVKALGCDHVVLCDGRDPWQVFKDERFIGNSRADPCAKILKRQLIDAHLTAMYPKDSVNLIFGIHWSEADRFERIDAKTGKLLGIRPRLAEKGWKSRAPLCEPPFISFEQMEQMATDAGLWKQKLYKDGFPHANCFSGDTRFLTSDGSRTLAEMEGESCLVLGQNGSWRHADIFSFGDQELWRIELSRFNKQKIIHATAGHRWITWIGERSNGRRDMLTSELVQGTRPVSMFGNGIASSIMPSSFGVAHGIVFGDGDRNDADSQGFTNPARLTLCGDKDAQLLKYFPLSPTTIVPETGIKVSNLPRYFKERPSLRESKSYLFGWLSGYFAADGTVKEDGECLLNSAKKENLDFCRDVCVRLGIGTNPIRERMRSGFGEPESALYGLPLMREMLREDFFLIADHRSRAIAAGFERSSIPVGWKVESAEPTGRHEEVFCATVPEGHVFTLEDNILTGNCGGRCVKQGQSGWALLYKTRPDRFIECRDKEEEMRQYLGKDVSMMSETKNGVKTPLPLVEFQKRLDAKQEMPLFDFGACACFAGEE